MHIHQTDQLASLTNHNSNSVQKTRRKLNKLSHPHSTRNQIGKSNPTNTSKSTNRNKNQELSYTRTTAKLLDREIKRSSNPQPKTQKRKSRKQQNRTSSTNATG
ncbi:hypothetical protein Droror1_Dr00019579 [Drosera rotundifolia]